MSGVKMAVPCLALLLVLLSPAAEATWQVQAVDKEDAKRQTQAFTGDEDDETLHIWFKEWKAKHNKDYSTPQEEQTAFSNFRQTLRNVRQTNMDDSLDYWTQPNQFADLDFSTFKSLYLMKADPTKFTSQAARKMLAGGAAAGHDGDVLGDADARPSSHGTSRMLATSRSIDWRKRGKFGPVRNQGACGACWAFAATSAIESAYHITKGTEATSSPVNLSEQQLISCANWRAGYGSNGCNGGCSDCAIKYVFAVNQTTEQRYPYEAKDGTCSKVKVSSPNGSAVQLGGTVLYVAPNSAQALMQAVDMQPVVVYWDVEDSFYTYAGGIWKPKRCEDAYNHAMVVVGYYWAGTTAGSYWILRNSWGTQWGDKGYVRVAFTDDKSGPCLMYKSPMVPMLAFTKSLA